MKKAAFILLVVILTMGVLSACSSDSAKKGSGSGKDGDVTLTFWKALDADNEEEIWAELIRKFEQAHPNIHVQFLATPWDGWQEKYTSAFAGSNPPDVSYMSEYLIKFAHAGKLHELDSFMSDSEKNRFSKTAIDNGTVNGKLYGVPFIAETSLMFYNKDIFEKEGIAIPQTWDELRAAAKKATKGPDQWGIGGLDILNTISFMVQSGANLFNKEGTSLGFNNPEGIRGLQFMEDLVKRDKVAPPIDFYSSPEQELDAFFKGKIAMMPGSIAFVNSIKTNAPNLQYGAFPAPAGPAEDAGAARALYSGIGLLSIAKASKHPAEAYEFIKFVIDPDNADLFFEPTGFFSALPEANETLFQGDPVMEMAKKSIQTMFVYPASESFAKAIDIVTQMREAVLRNVKTPEQAIKDAAKEFDSTQK
ncbi:ABC transporter substrate-binding protein [Cohnella silvisoli]|uniref:ABC transporter substrate-binding protein n=1 Tax=Cohnella silvisoli TaxID=2873699 RepID=A0ABV1L1V1_9BACL|nr:ABC transporter substrate-binding protein [Cohnella silvisoli]MCD9025136.1 ABC transporter substrate-binding protein [Cohnella silvisoli]